MRPDVCLASLLLLCCCATTLLAVHQDTSPHTRTAVSGQPAVLPCPTAPLTPHRASHHLILVFKDGQSSPVYSWDSRVKTLPNSDGCSRCPSKQLEGRSYFWSPESDSASPANDDSVMHELMPDWRNHIFQANFLAESSSSDLRNATEYTAAGRRDSKAGAARAWTPQETGLVLDPVRLSDAGDYICRVDFPNSPTRNTFVQLRVVEPMRNISVRGFMMNSPVAVDSAQTASVKGHDAVNQPSALHETKETDSTTTSQSYSIEMTSSNLNDLSHSKILPKENIDQSVRSPMRSSSAAETRRLFENDNGLQYKKEGSLPKRTLVPSTLPPPKVLGPYPVGTELLLQCEVIHGSPAPTLRWEDDEGSLVAASAMTVGLRRSSISYRLANITLASIGAFITCVAQNSPLTPVLRDSVIIDVGVPPSSVKILASQTDHQFSPANATQLPKSTAKNFPHPNAAAKPAPHTRTNWTLLAESGLGGSLAPYEADEGREVRLVCESSASRPAADLLWTRADNLPLAHHFVKVTHLPGSPTSLTLTRSALHMRASAALHGAVLQCSVAAQQSALSTAVQLSVNYAPLVELSSNSSSPAVEENSSIAFHCRVTAHPPPEGVILLYKNDDVIHEWVASGTTEETKTVAVTVGGAEWSGHYSCAASNAVGTATSQPLHLRVNYAPRCAGAPPTSYSTRGAEPLLVTCSVAAQPRPSGFRWYVVPQDGSAPVQLDPSSHQDHGRSSTLQYVPPPRPPYPLLHCFAHNHVGSMSEPCVINIVPAAEPDSVQTCRAGPADGDEDSSISVICEPGRDGGLNQSFTLEVRPTRNPLARPPKALYLSSTSTFKVLGLLPNEEYTFTVTASNARGLSDPYILTYVVPLEKIQAFPSVILREDITPVLLIAFGAMAAVITCSLGALLARWFFVRSKNVKVQHRREHSGCATSTSDYRRLHQYNNGSLVRGSSKSTMLTSCVRPSASTGRSCFYADASSCGDDSLSRSSCRSATDTLLWTLSSDSESNRTFRNSGCYHIANLTPPECSAMIQSPQTGDYRHHQILVTEIHAPDTPRSSSSRFSVPSCRGDKSVDSSSPCGCSSPISFPNAYACPSPSSSHLPNGGTSPSSYGHCCGSRPSTALLNREPRLSCHEFSGLSPEQCSYRGQPREKRQADFDITGPCPEVEALLNFENGAENQEDIRASNGNTYPCKAKQNRIAHETLHTGLHETVIEGSFNDDNFTQNKSDEQKHRSTICGESEEEQSNCEDLRSRSSDLEDSDAVKEASLELLTVPSDTSSDHSSRPSSSVSMATVALNPNYDLDQQLPESDS